MNIRKIIKEEIDGFDWVKDVPTFELPRIVDSEYGGGYNLYMTTQTVRYLLSKEL